MKNTQKGFIVPLLIAIIAVLVIGTGVYIYKNGNDTNQSGTTSNNEISDGKIYQSAQYGFQFKYPSTWELKERGNSEWPEIVLTKDNDNINFFSVGSSYLIIYPNGKPGSGAPSLPYVKDSSISLAEQINPSTVVKLNSGDIAAMNITFSNPPQKNTDTEIYAGIKVDNLEYSCISDTTGTKLPNDRCFSGDHEAGVEYGTNKISGSLVAQDKSELYSILQSFSFLKN